MINKSNTNNTLTFTYDYLGRRVEKAVANWPWIVSDTRYLWFGWNLAAELSGDGVTPTKAFVYGPDFSDAHGNAGGAGSLLAQISGGVVNYAVPDTLGNIVGYANGTSLSAAVEYSPFGRAVATYGTYTNFPFGYSGHYTDWETNLSYYGLRYYMPKHGRFINRDPSEEGGGTNLFAFVGNSPTNGWDVMGLDDEAVEMAPFVVTASDLSHMGDPVAEYNQQALIDQINQANAQTVDGNSGSGSSGGGGPSGSGPSNGKGKGDGNPPSKPPCVRARAALAAAENSAAAYNDAPPAPGWQRVSPASLGLTPSDLYDSESGFAAAVFKNIDTGALQVAYRGTEKAFNDIRTDVAQATGYLPSQYAEASILALRMASYAETQGVGLTFVGHSLGGGLAAFAAMSESGRYSATTFNAAGVSFLAAPIGGSSSYITTYYVNGDPLHAFQALPGVSSADGARVPLPGNGKPWVLANHSIKTVIARLKDLVASACK